MLLSSTLLGGELMDRDFKVKNIYNNDIQLILLRWPIPTK